MKPTTGTATNDGGPRPRPEDWAGLVNGGLILCVPIAFYVVWLLSPPSGNTAVGRDPLVSDLDRVVRPLFVLAYSMMFFLPVALIVGWRTWVHAKEVRAGRAHGWQGIFEAGATGLGFALLVLLRPTIMNPTQAPPYLIAYGGIGAAVGLALGAILAMTALLTLTIASAVRRRRAGESMITLGASRV